MEATFNFNIEDDNSTTTIGSLVLNFDTQLLSVYDERGCEEIIFNLKEDKLELKRFHQCLGNLLEEF